MYKSRPITVVIHENINYILTREKLTKELLYKAVGHQKNYLQFRCKYIYPEVGRDS